MWLETFPLNGTRIFITASPPDVRWRLCPTDQFSVGTWAAPLGRALSLELSCAIQFMAKFLSATALVRFARRMSVKVLGLVAT